MKAPALTRNSFAPDELAKLTPEHDKACADLLKLEGGVMTGGPFPEYGPKLRVIFPGWTEEAATGGACPTIPRWAICLSIPRSDGMLNKLVKKQMAGRIQNGLHV